MTTCNWCGVSGDLNITVYEGYGRLCHGCRFCVKHGSPRRMEEDQPFTKAQKELETWTERFFADAIHVAKICNQPLPKEAV